MSATAPLRNACMRVQRGTLCRHPQTYAHAHYIQTGAAATRFAFHVRGVA